MGVNINKNIGGNQVQQNSTSNFTITTTTTTQANGITEYPNSPPPWQNIDAMQAYSGSVGCSYPLTIAQLMKMKQSIASKTFEDSKLTMARQIICSNCLLSKHVKEIIMLFDFESTRLELAKYAYGNTFDIGNYFLLNDAFEFESSIDELNMFIESRR
ncbi:MAG: DUF4476 domain-containing protein [Bacteroidales bacterium]|nr:DUF4476 domain-containing protein [Bacteroidales bacterium]